MPHLRDLAPPQTLPQDSIAAPEISGAFELEGEALPVAMNYDRERFGDVPYHLIRKLYPDTRSWVFWSPSPNREQIEALAEIRSKQLAGFLPYLAPLVANSSPAVQQSAAGLIEDLLSRDLAGSLSFLSIGLHRSVHYETAAATALNGILREGVKNLTVPEKSAWAVFGLLSFHGSGWVREAALDRLGAMVSGREIPFLLYRSNDWVDLIATKANRLLHERLARIPVRQFSAHLPVIFALRRRDRGYLSEFQVQLLDRIAREEEIDFFAAMADGGATVGFRRWLLSLATSKADIRSEAVAFSLRLRGDADPLVRTTAWDRIWKQPPDKIELKEALADKWPAIRRRCLETICARNPHDQQAVLLAALFDGSGMVRATARYFLEKIGIAPAEIYRARLSGPETPSSTAIFGLSECGIKADAELLRPLLSSIQTKTYRAAVLAVGKLDAPSFIPEIKLALQAKSQGVSKAARQILEKHPHALTREFLFGLLDEKHPLHVRRSVVWLIRSLGKWERIILLLEALPLAPEFNDVIREEIGRWLTMYNRNFTTPTHQHTAELQEQLAIGSSLLPPETIQELRQIVGSFLASR